MESETYTNAFNYERFIFLKDVVLIAIKNGDDPFVALDDAKKLWDLMIE